MESFSITSYAFIDKVDKDTKLLLDEDLTQPTEDLPQNQLDIFKTFPKLLNAYSSHAHLIQHPRKANLYLEQNSILFAILKRLNKKVSLLIPNDQQNELELFQKQLANEIPNIANAVLNHHSNNTLTSDNFKDISLFTRCNIIHLCLNNDVLQTKCVRYINDDNEVCLVINTQSNSVEYVHHNMLNTYLLRILDKQQKDSSIKEKILKMKVEHLKIVAQIFNIKTKSLKKQEIINSITSLIENIETIT